jgi:hypothetical protein
MKAEELRIGNYITVSNPKSEILEIRETTIEQCNYHHITDLYRGNKEWVYKPIPLTEQWLIDFGFVKLGDGYEFWESSVFNIEFTRNHWHICYTSNVLCTHIKHVHELQNLYFALTKNELLKQ